MSGTTQSSAAREEEEEVVLYEETWWVPFAPVVFFLPLFYKFGVKVTSDKLTFGYGFSKPGNWTSKTILVKNIEKDSIVTGSASWKENLMSYGGWGIRYGIDGTIVYNAQNGEYIELVESENGQKYHFVSNDVKTVESLLKGIGKK